MMGRPVHGPAHKRTGGSGSGSRAGPKTLTSGATDESADFREPTLSAKNASHSEATTLPSRTNTQRVSGRSGSTELSFSTDFPRGLTLKIAFDILAT